MNGFSIDELERDLGTPAKLKLLMNAGGQSRYVPTPARAADSAMARELGPEIAHWLAARYSGETISFPSVTGSERERKANLLRAAVLEAGLTDPTRSANDIAKEFRVTVRHVRDVRHDLRKDQRRQPEHLPLFRDL